MPPSHNEPKGGPLFDQHAAEADIEEAAYQRDVAARKSPLARVEEQPLAVVPSSADSEVGQLIRLALEKGQDPKELYALLREERGHRARMEFSQAMANFKGECPPIPKRHDSQFDVTDKGVKRKRKYADLEDIDRIIAPIMAKHGLHYRWGSAVVKDAMLSQSCIVSHVAGHFEESTITLPTGSAAGCSEAQKYMSASTYARRYSLIAAAGLTSCDEDTDGADDGDPGECITTEQSMALNDALIDCGGNRETFLKAFQIDKLAALPASRFDQAWQSIQDKKRQLKK